MARVSVIMPLFNGAAFVMAALQSLTAQGFGDLQVIVVNDGSTDGGEKLVEEWDYPAVILHQSRAGPAAARNRGLEVAEGEYLAFIDADDLWPEVRLREQLKLLRDRPDLELVQGQLQALHLENGNWVPRDKPLFAHSLCSALFRREVFNRVGSLDESLPYCEDVDWFFAAQRAGVNLERFEKVWAFYRRHDGNLTNRRHLVRQYTLQVVAKHRRILDGASG